MKNFPKIVLWLPRVITILFALFLSIFALDVFEEHQSFMRIMFALLMHLIPTFLILLIMILSWKREIIASVGYFILGVAYIVIAWGKFHLVVYFAISGPLFLVSVLYLINWFERVKSKKRLNRK